MKITRLAAIGAAASIIAVGAFAAAPANAEPVSNGYVVVGSDTLQDSMNALTNGTKVTGSTVRVVANSQPLGNFDAFGSELIQTKSLGSRFARPSGSGAGIAALRASAAGRTWQPTSTSAQYTVAGQIDIARSSSGPASSDLNNDGVLTYIPYARDAVSYAFRGDASALGSLTTDQLKTIYSSATPVTVNGVTVQAVLPQSTSGTRSFFLKAIGVSTVGGSVSQPANLPENDASVLTADNQIIPFSAASWIAQANQVAPSTLNGSVNLGAPNGVAAFTGSGTSLVASSTFYNAAPYGRDTYLVVETARITSSNAKYDAALAAVVNPSSTSSLTGWRTSGDPLDSQPAAVKLRFGFLKPSTSVPIRAFAAL